MLLFFPATPIYWKKRVWKRNIKYTHNNGQLAADPKLAVNSFLRALEKIPSLIEKYRNETEKLSKDLPVLQEIVHSTWRKENELKDLKTELAAVDRKIQLSLKKIDESEDKQPDEMTAIKMSDSRQPSERIDNEPPNNTADVSGNTGDDDYKKEIAYIQGLFSGKVKPADLTNGNPFSYPADGRLQHAKEALGDRLVIASIPKYQSKGIRR